MPVDEKKYLNVEGLAYFWEKIKTYVGEVVESGTSDIANKLHFVVPNEKSSTASLTASIDGIDALSPGLAIALRMPFNNSYNTTLNINNLGAKPIYYKSSTVSSGMFPSGSIVLLIYETTSVASGCFKAVYSYDSDTAYYTSLYASNSTSATSNSYSETDPDSTYLVSVDRTTSGSIYTSNSIKLLGAGGISVTAKNGTVTFRSPEYDRIGNEMIDALFNNEYVYLDKTFTVPSQNTYYGTTGLIYVMTYNQEDGSSTGIDYVTYVKDHENENKTLTIPSNQDYLLTIPFCKLTTFLGEGTSGISINIRGTDEDGVVHRYYTVGSSIDGCESAKYTTFAGTLNNAAAEEINPKMGLFWNVINFDPTEINGPSGEISIDLEFDGYGYDDYENTFTGRMIGANEPKFRMTFYKDQSGENVMMKVHYICVM